MNLSSKEKINIIKQNLIFYFIGFLVIFGIKFFYSKAGSDDLLWILAPTTKWVEILSGIPFTYEHNVGYVNHGLRFLIAPSCSGVQFMLITIATLIFSFVHRMGISKEGLPCKPSQHLRRGFCWTIVSIIVSYILTVFINGLRIIVAIYLPLYLRRWNVYNGFLTPEKLHTIIGTVIYFISLLTIYRLAGYISSKIVPLPKKHTDEKDTADENTQAFSVSDPLLPQIIRKCIPPVFWYFLIVLGIPFLNGAYRNGNHQFKEFALLITCVCLIVLGLYLPVSLIHTKLKRNQ